MKTQNVSTTILHFEKDHASNMEESLRDLLKRFSPKDIVISLETLLSTKKSSQKYRDLTAFTRDICLYKHYAKDLSPAIRKFRHHVFQSDILDILINNIYSSNSSIRVDSFYTLGKIGAKKYTKLLKEAVPTYVEKYPRQLSQLLFEISWLSSSTDIKTAKTLLEHRSYLVRLETLRYISSRINTLSKGQVATISKLLSKLKNSRSEKIKKEVQYLQQELEKISIAPQ